ncbi:MAG: malto-oligosyltrehalose trehalohydrolase [Acidobacteria bacterium]|nr:malto-oligosyltrehalose trehalohydrolase [Acidobacteriota bacterium]MBV9070600.1 malto-oligosyltrehalose trehalohydrolase [Acidobacteriota bacterium]MBV9188472.1 malto-oligosyltrehalose trehalohydrolase [Acidobacteriota bacterium]
MRPDETPILGANLIAPGRCEFRVWAPNVESVELHIVGAGSRESGVGGRRQSDVADLAISDRPISDARPPTPDSRVKLTKNARGYHEATIDAGAGTRYFFNVNGDDRPDPASRLQPEGVHGPSEVVSREFEWHDAGWKGVALEDYVVYELHVGTFTREGTFDAVIEHLDALKDLGITAVELLPIAQFPGTRNWGYDGVYIGAAQNSYGGPAGLKRLADACHARGLALLLDVVYNHLGPEGNYLGQYAPYFTDRYKTPWGLAINFDGPHSDDVRWFFIHNALQWIDEFHIDGLRVDAVHAIVDHTAEPFLQDLTSAVRQRAEALGRRVYTIAESNLNDPRVITPKDDFGLGFDSQWCDDFHHSLHTLLTAERDGYYADYGRTSDLARTLTGGYLYTGQHSPYFKRRYGAPPKTRDGKQFVVFAQNHDQVGNRMLGDRLSSLGSIAKLRLAAAAVVLSPFIPMLFMGEEYGETAPFQYFTSHGDEDLIEAVRKGRAEEFDDFEWEGEPPDPHDEETFQRSKLTRIELDDLRSLYRDLLRLRREIPALRSLDLDAVETRADDEQRTLLLQRGDTLLAFNFSDREQEIALSGSWTVVIDCGARLALDHISLQPEAFALLRR